MIRVYLSVFVIVGCCVEPGLAQKTLKQPRDAWNSTGKQGAVAAGRRVAVDAGIEILKRGGNAVDAAVATLLVQSVTASKQFCFGGEVPIIVYDAKRQTVEVLSGQGTAPRLATLQYFLDHKNRKIHGKGDPSGAAVPATLHACLTALERYGSMTFTEVAQPLLRALDRDEPAWSRDLTRTIGRLIDAEQRSPDDRRRGIQLARDYFYRGPVARELDAWSRENGGLIRYDDMAAHKTRIEQPVSIQYRGYTIHKCGPWTQGPYLLQTLRLLEGFDLKSMKHNSPEYVHVVIEAMKLALADRDAFYGDPLFVDVPLKQLLSKDYAELRRPLINTKQASAQQRPGDPWAGKPLLRIAPQAYKVSATPLKEGKISSAPWGSKHVELAVNDTTTCLVADKLGNVVVATPSGWGGILAGRTGVVLGSRLISLNTWNGHPNCIAPGKRPRITLTPTMIFKNGKPIFAISVAGGDYQDQTTLQVLLNHIEFGLKPAEAVTAARFSTGHLIGSFNQPAPKLASLTIYKKVGKRTIGELESRRHVVRQVDGPIASPIALFIDPESGIRHVAGDPRARRHADAY